MKERSHVYRKQTRFRLRAGSPEGDRAGSRIVAGRRRALVRLSGHWERETGFHARTGRSCRTEQRPGARLQSLAIWLHAFLENGLGVLGGAAQYEGTEILYQSPSGACGSVSTQFFNYYNSENEIARSATRSKMCCQTGPGRLANRIFGNRVLPEDRADQILPRLAL